MSGPARHVLLIAALAGLAAEDVAENDTTIPPLAPSLLAPMWPRLRASLPVAFAAVHGGAVVRDDAEVEGSALAGGMSHPDPAWSWGAGALVSERAVGAGDDLPQRIRSARVFVGWWWRRSIDDHLIVLTAPGASWAEDSGRVGVSVPVIGAWLHQHGTTTWILGLAAIADRDGLLPLPFAGALLAPEDWRLVLTPLLVSAERLIGADGGIGVQAGFTGASAPLPDVDGERQTLALWDLRLGVRGRWSFPWLDASVEAGWVAVGRASVGSGLADPDAEVRHLRAAPYGGLGVSRSW